MMRAHNFDAVLTDHNMPLLDDACDSSCSDGIFHLQAPLGRLIEEAAILRNIPYVGTLSNKGGHGFPTLLIREFSRLMEEHLGVDSQLVFIGKSMRFRTDEKHFIGWTPKNNAAHFHTNEEKQEIRQRAGWSLAHSKELAKQLQASHYNDDKLQEEQDAYNEQDPCKGWIQAKNWRALLEHMIQCDSRPGIAQRFAQAPEGPDTGPR